MNLIVNSWFPIYFDITLKDMSKEETRKNIIQLEAFLEKFYENDYCIILLESGQTQEKFYRMSKELKNYSDGYKRIKEVTKKIIYNSSKLRIVSELIPLSQEIETLIAANTTYEKDRFLLLTAAQIPENEKIIITTDNRLIEQFKDNSEYKFGPLNQFLVEY